MRTESRIWPMLTRATVPLGLPHAPRMPVCRRSAPAHDSILLMRTTWYGWARTRMWKPSLPAILIKYLFPTEKHGQHDSNRYRPRRRSRRGRRPLWGGRTYLLAQMRAASRASDDSCSYSFEMRCTHVGNSSTLARLRPRSKMRILGSGTPRLKRDLGYG